MKFFQKKASEFDTSPENQEAHRKAYDAAYKYFEEADPEYLSGIIKANGGKKTGLDAFNDFGDMEFLEYTALEDAARASWSERTKFDWEKYDHAHTDYSAACADATEALLGKYGFMSYKVAPDQGSGKVRGTVDEIMMRVMDELESMPIDWWPKD